MGSLRPMPAPAPPTPLIAREAEAASVIGLIDAGGRLVTLTGPPGVGKTRLALHLARVLAERFPEGVAFASLDAIRDAALVPAVVARSLGVREEAGRTLTESLAEAVGEARLLLILDNFEHVISAAPAVAELLSLSPNLVVLVTSRTPLTLRAEVRVPVDPLAISRLNGHEGGREKRETRLGEAALIDVATSPAVELFVHRARAVRPYFALTGENVGDVLAICTALDGLPLALELAAARLAMFSSREIVERLTARLSLLTGGYRDLPARHRTLRAAIDWSYDLLSPDAQRTLRVLSVFSGGASFDALAVVAAGLAAHDDAAALSDRLGELGEQSLLRRDEDAEGRSRYSMLETIREYAAEQLAAAGEAEEAKLFHAAYFETFTEAAETRLGGPDQRDWLRRLDAEHDNVRAALGWALASGHGDAALRLAGAAAPFWRVRGALREGRDWLARSLRAAVRAPAAARAKALDGAGLLAQNQGDWAAAGRLHEESLALLREIGDERGIANALNQLGALAGRLGDYARAVTLLEECLALRRTIDDRPGIARASQNLGTVARRLGDYATARVRYGESLAIYETLDDAQSLAMAFNNLANVQGEEGEFAEARDLLHRSLRLRFELGDRPGIASNLEGLADAALALGDYAEAAHLHAVAGALRMQIGSTLPAADRANLERSLAAEQAALGEAAFARVWERGIAADLDRVIAALLAGEALDADGPDAARAERAGSAPDAEDGAETAADPLTRREREVLALIAQGRSNAEIAGALVLSIRTVERHVSNIYAKLALEGPAARAVATAWALTHGLRTP